MAGNHDRDRVPSVRGANGAKRFRAPEPARQFRVGERLAVRNLAQLTPDLELPARPLGRELEVELAPLPREILAELARDVAEGALRGLPVRLDARRPAGAFEVDPPQSRPVRPQQQSPKRGPGEAVVDLPRRSHLTNSTPVTQGSR